MGLVFYFAAYHGCYKDEMKALPHLGLPWHEVMQEAEALGLPGLRLVIHSLWVQLNFRAPGA